jgi:RecA/RadA recombinase
MVFVNQVRSDISMTNSYSGPLETTTGGKAMHHYVSYRLKLMARKSKESRIMDGNEFIGNYSQCILVKNRWGSPMLSCDFPIYFVERERDKFLEFFSLAEKKKKVRYGWKQYLYPWVEKVADATYATKNLEEYKNYMISNDIIKLIADDLKIKNSEQYQLDIAEDVIRVREERQAREENLKMIGIKNNNEEDEDNTE